MQLTRLDSRLLRALYGLIVGILAAQLLQLSAVVSLLFTLTFPLTVLLWLSTLCRRIDRWDLLTAATILLALGCVLVNARLTGTAVSFGYLKKWIMFAVTLIFLQTAGKLEPTPALEAFVLRWTDRLCGLLVVFFLLCNSQMYRMNGATSAYLVLRFTNPNLAALFLACFLLLVTPRLLQDPPRRHDRRQLRVFGWLLLLLYLTKCRTAWLAAGAALLACVPVYLHRHAEALARPEPWQAAADALPAPDAAAHPRLAAGCARLRQVWLQRVRPFAAGRVLPLAARLPLRIGRPAAAVLAVFPAVFCAVYVAVIDSPVVQILFGFLSGEGKGLNSRMKTWLPALEGVAQSPLVGAYSQISGGTGASQMHNSHLDVLASYGVFVFVLFCLLLYHHVFGRGRRYRSHRAFAYRLGFCGALLLGLGEAVLFSGGLSLQVVAGLLLLLSNMPDRADAPSADAAPKELCHEDPDPAAQ